MVVWYLFCSVFKSVVFDCLLDVFKPDESFLENEEKYKQLKKGKLCLVVVHTALWLFSFLCTL